METPSLWPDSFLSPPTPGSRWPCEVSQTSMWEHPSWNICVPFTLPFCNQHLSATLGLGLHTRVVAALRRTTWGRDPHRSWKWAQGRRLGRDFQDPRYMELNRKGEECYSGWAHSLGSLDPSLLWRDMALGRLERDPLKLGAQGRAFTVGWSQEPTKEHRKRSRL